MWRRGALEILTALVNSVNIRLNFVSLCGGWQCSRAVHLYRIEFDLYHV